MTQKPRWAVKFFILFGFMMMLGFIPWEPLLSIQIRSNILNLLTSATMGLSGLFGLVCIVLIFIRRSYKRFDLPATILLLCLLIPIALILITTLVLPAFRWQDTDVYRNDNDYLVVQEFEGFVTSSLRNPRVVRTTSPFALIRKVEEQYELKENDDRFRGNEVIYQGKIWHKLPNTNNDK
jgi:hypothetical protein